MRLIPDVTDSVSVSVVVRNRRSVKSVQRSKHYRSMTVYDASPESVWAVIEKALKGASR